jgi:hypothetical protein
MGWTERLEQWAAACRRPGPEAHLLLEAARHSVKRNSTDDWHWLYQALGDPKRKGFVALVFKYQPVPKRLLAAFLYAAVLESNPSRNRMFIEPCIRSWGGLEVNRRLLRYLREGTNEEKAGAASAFYWAQSNPRGEDLVEIRSLIRRALLLEFVCNPDVQVRQRIVPLLNLDPSAYEEPDHPLIVKAIATAKSHSDEYIRHRIEIQLGGAGSFQAIPVMQRDTA